MAWTAWTAVRVRNDAQAARDELRSLRDDLDAATFLEGDGLEDLESFADRFERIGDRLDSPLLLPVSVLPVAGRQLAAARDQVDAASGGLRAAVAVGRDLDALVDQGLGSGPERIETLRSVAATARRGRTAFEALDLGPDDALLGPLADAREEIDEALTEALEGLDRTATMSDGLAVFFEGPSDYLLLAANNAQMQNGQGMFLSAGMLHVEAGRMDLGSMESLEKVPEVVPPIPLEADLAARWGWLDPNQDIRHLGLTHRFGVTAQTAAALWPALGNPEVDGVVVVDPHVLEAIMHATGPILTPQGERRAEDVLEFILHDQYQGYLTDGADTSYTDVRRDELDEIARTVLEEFESITDLDPEFLDRFRAAASGRHLLLWSADPMVQAGFEAAGVDGQITPESLLLSLVNRSGVKLDWFMEMDADLSVERVGDVYEAELEIAITNEAPASGEPRYVVGPYPGSGLAEGDYLGLVTLNLPEGATNSRFDGVEPLAVSGPDGANRTIAAWVRVARGTTTTVVARFELPGSMEELLVEPSARTNPTEWSFEQKDWKDKERRTLAL